MFTDHEGIIIEVRGKDYNGKLLEEITRIPQKRSGYDVIRYKHKNYKLWGGIRNNFRIIV